MKQIATCMALLIVVLACGCGKKPKAEPMDDFSIFDDSTLMFMWSSATPAEIIRFYADNVVSNSLPGSKLFQIECLGEPRYLTGAKKKPDDPDHVIMARMGIAFQTRLVIDKPDGSREEVSGVSALICQNLDHQEDLTIWLEFFPDGNLDEIEESLKTKVYEEHPTTN